MLNHVCHWDVQLQEWSRLFYVKSCFCSELVIQVVVCTMMQKVKMDIASLVSSLSVHES